MSETGSLHHVELWVPDPTRAVPSWGWLLGRLGYTRFQDWPAGAGVAAAIDGFEATVMARCGSRHARRAPGTPVSHPCTRTRNPDIHGVRCLAVLFMTNSVTNNTASGALPGHASTTKWLRPPDAG